MEIERKFLVKEMPSIFNCKYFHISQGYLSFNPEVRIRKIVSDYEKYFLTVKSDGTISREEYEVEISEFVFNSLRKNIKGKMLSKRRYQILIGNKIAELDIYDDFPEKIVEVEFASMKEAKNFIIPNWFGREVTNNQKYKNKNLFKEINRL